MLPEAFKRACKILTAVFGVCTVICTFIYGPDIARGWGPTPHEKDALRQFSN